MANVTLEQINKNILELNKELSEMKGKIEEIQEFIQEDFELADDVKKEIWESRKRPISEFMKHEDVVKRYS